MFLHKLYMIVKALTPRKTLNKAFWN